MNRFKPSPQGFTLLEAVVALALLAAGTIVLYGWYGTILLGLSKAEDRLLATQFSRNLEAYLLTMNLQQESSGEYRANGYLATWNAQLVEPIKDGKTLSGGLSYYQLGLYDLSIEITRESDSTYVDELETRLVGYAGSRIPPDRRL